MIDQPDPLTATPIVQDRRGGCGVRRVSRWYVAQTPILPGDAHT
jgi:hypothetical protein